MLQPIQHKNSEKHTWSPYEPINAKSSETIAKKYGISTPVSTTKKPLSITTGTLPPVNSNLWNIQGVSRHKHGLSNQ